MSGLEKRAAGSTGLSVTLVGFGVAIIQSPVDETLLDEAVRVVQFGTAG